MRSALMARIFMPVGRRHGILPRGCAPTARGCCDSCNYADVCVLLCPFVLCEFQEEDVNLVIGDSSLCAVMADVLVYTCCKGCQIRCYATAMLFLLQDELDRGYAGVVAADLLLVPVAPAWERGLGGRLQLAALEPAGPS